MTTKKNWLIRIGMIGQSNRFNGWPSPQTMHQRIQSNLNSTLAGWNDHSSRYQQIINMRMIKLKEIIKMQPHTAKRKWWGNLKYPKLWRHLKSLSTSLSNKNVQKEPRSLLWSAAYSITSAIQLMNFCSRIKRYRHSLRYLSAS